jgi:hypothetical protein
VKEKLLSSILQLKLTLLDVKPPIWRRVVVPSQITLRRLHEIIQAVTGWDDAHAHEFDIAHERYGEPAPHEVVPVRNEVLAHLHSLPLAAGTKFTYVYDFGDHWEVELEVEKVLPRNPHDVYPSLLDGVRAFPPEDYGGAPEYMRLLRTLSDATDPEYEESRSRVGNDFDPERFDRATADERLRPLVSE